GGVENFALSLNGLLRVAEIDWHGTRLGSPDWADTSHSIALTLRSGRNRLPLWLHIVFNAYWEALDFDLPPEPMPAFGGWGGGLATASECPEDTAVRGAAPPVPGLRCRVGPRSVAALFLSIDPGEGSSDRHADDISEV